MFWNDIKDIKEMVINLNHRVFNLERQLKEYHQYNCFLEKFFREFEKIKDEGEDFDKKPSIT